MDEERPQGSDLIGPIIGGVLGGLCLLLVLLLLTVTVILIKILFYRKSKLDKATYARQGIGSYCMYSCMWPKALVEHDTIIVLSRTKQYYDINHCKNC